MLDKALISLLSIFFIGGGLFAAPRQENPLIQEMRLSLEKMEYKLHSQGIDLQLIQERANQLETTLSGLKQDLKTTSSDKTLEKRIASLEKAHELIATDFKTIKTAINETSASLNQCQSHLAKLDKQLSSDIHSLKASLGSMLAILQPSPDETKHYIVQTGDSLGQIALDHKTDVKTIKKLNNLNSDIIYSGQKLILP